MNLDGGGHSDSVDWALGRLTTPLTFFFTLRPRAMLTLLAVCLFAFGVVGNAQIATSQLSGLSKCKYSDANACLPSPQTNPLSKSLGLADFQRGIGMCSMMGVTPVNVSIGASYPAMYMPTSAEVHVYIHNRQMHSIPWHIYANIYVYI